MHDWAAARGHEIVHEPRPFPEYHPRFYATFFLALHGFMIEAVTYEDVGGGRQWDENPGRG